MPKIPKYILAGLAVIVAVVLLWYFRSIVLYILIAAVLAIIGKPLMDLFLKIEFRKRHLPRWFAALVTVLVMWCVIIALFFVFIPIIVSKIDQLMSADASVFPASFFDPVWGLEDWIRNTFALGADFSLWGVALDFLKKLLDPSLINSVVPRVVSVIGSIAVAAFSITFISFFFLKERDMFTNIIVTASPARYEEKIRHAMTSVTTLLKRYFIGILAESTIMFTFISVMLLVFGLAPRDALFIGLTVGVLNVIPYVGPLISWCISVVIGVLSPVAGASILTMVLIVGLAVISAQIIDNLVLQPILYSKSAKAHPLEIFIVILMAGSVGGIWGMLVAIPSYNVIRVFAKEFFNRFRVVQSLTKDI
jgi:predicted PurR-regulated permease PerM